MDNSEPLEDSDVILSDSGERSRAVPWIQRKDGQIPTFCLPLFFITDEELEGYDKLVSGRRKTGRVSHFLHTWTAFRLQANLIQNRFLLKSDFWS